jgi:hypothetical protein
MIDNPHVRADTTCPLCLHAKATGLVLCWPCHNEQKRFHDGGYSARTEARIATRERYLAVRARLGS